MTLDGSGDHLIEPMKGEPYEVPRAGIVVNGVAQDPEASDAAALFELEYSKYNSRMTRKGKGVGVGVGVVVVV